MPESPTPPVKSDEEMRMDRLGRLRGELAAMRRPRYRVMGIEYPIPRTVPLKRRPPE